MTEKGLIKFIGKMPKIQETALINRAYFAEAVRVCENASAVVKINVEISNLQMKK